MPLALAGMAVRVVCAVRTPVGVGTRMLTGRSTGRWCWRVECAWRGRRWRLRLRRWRWRPPIHHRVEQEVNLFLHPGLLRMRRFECLPVFLVSADGFIVPGPNVVVFVLVTGLPRPTILLGRQSSTCRDVVLRIRVIHRTAGPACRLLNRITRVARRHWAEDGHAGRAAQSPG